jgi:ABC-type dipeptide/oligopeptide/nickel transport system permease subunit
MSTARKFIGRFGWETLLGTTVLLLIFACGVILPYVMNGGDPVNRADSYCTPSVAGKSVMASAGEGGETPAEGALEENLFGGEPASGVKAQAGAACSRNYLFGTDVSGRDIFYYVMTTSTKYIVPSIIVMAISVVLGSFFGIMAGYYGEHIAGEGVSMVSNAISVYPPLLFVLLLTRILNNPSIEVIAAVYALTESARLGFMVMNKIQVLREEEFIAAAKEMGLSDWKIITKHLLWYNCREVLLVHGVFSVAGFVMI